MVPSVVLSVLCLLTAPLAPCLAAPLTAIFDVPASAWWYEVYDSACSTLLGNTGYESGATSVCVHFQSAANASLLDDTAAVVYFLSGATLHYVVKAVLDTTSSLVFTTATFLGDGATSYHPTLSTLASQQNTFLATKPLCGAKTMRTSAFGVTTMDCCRNPTMDTCLSRAQMNFTSLANKPTRCVASYYGLGSVYGTVCENYYCAESDYCVTSMPDVNSDVFTNFGQQPRTSAFGCYIENWSNYRQSSWGRSFSYDDTMVQCDEVFYAFQWGDSLDWREPHDPDVLRKLAAAGTPSWLTLGGWTALGDPTKASALYASIVTNHTRFVAHFINVLRTFSMRGLDLDIEWPNARGMETLDTAVFKEHLLKVCQAVRADGKKCSVGVLPAGLGYDPDYYALMANDADRFNVFGYDMYGCFDLTQPYNQALYNGTGWSLRLLLTRLLTTVQPSKISLGLPQYVRGFSFSSSGQAVGCAPDERYSGLLEGGIDTLVIDSGRVRPRQCSSLGTEPRVNYTIYKDPTNQMMSSVCKVIKTDGSYSIYPFYDDEELGQLAAAITSEFAVTQFYTYAWSMDSDVGLAYKSAIKRASRSKRAVDSPAYAYPAPPQAGRVQCPSIVYYSATLIVTVNVYQGCVRPTGMYCYYKTSQFACVTSTVQSPPMVITTWCEGVDVNTLLPSTASSKTVMCNDLRYYVASSSVCADSYMAPHELPTISVEPITTRGFYPKKLDVYGEPSINYTSLQLPHLCTSFPQPLSCVEAICGADTACLSSLQQSAYMSFCASTSDALIAYYDAVKTAQLSADKFNNAKRALKAVASTRGTTASARKRRNPLLLVGGVLFGAYMFMDSRAMKQDIEALKAGQTQLVDAHNALAKRTTDIETNLLALQHKTNEVITNAAIFANATAARFDKVDQQFAAVAKSQQEIVDKTNAKFSTQASQIAALTGQVSDLSAVVTSLAKLSAAAMTYSSHIHTQTVAMVNYALEIDRATDMISACHNSLNLGDLRDCVPDAAGTRLADITFVNVSATEHLLVTYLRYPVASSVTYYGNTAYCSDGKLFTAAPGCQFVQRTDGVYHLTNGLAPCAPPYYVTPMNCSASRQYVNLTGVLVSPVTGNAAFIGNASAAPSTPGGMFNAMNDTSTSDIDRKLQELDERMRRFNESVNSEKPSFNYSIADSDYDEIVKRVMDTKTITDLQKVTDYNPLSLSTTRDKLLSATAVAALVLLVVIIAVVIYLVTTAKSKTPLSHKFDAPPDVVVEQRRDYDPIATRRRKAKTKDIV